MRGVQDEDEVEGGLPTTPLAALDRTHAKLCSASPALQGSAEDLPHADAEDSQASSAEVRSNTVHG